MDARAGALAAQAEEAGLAAVRRQLNLLRRRRGLFVLTSLAVLIIGGAGALLLPARYDATAEVMIDPRREKVVDLPQVMQDLPTDAAAADSEVEVLKARPLAERVAAQLGLAHDAEFPGRSADPARAAVDALVRKITIVRVGFTYVIAITAKSASPEKAARIANTLVELYLRQQVEAKSLAARSASDWLNGRLGAQRAEVEAAENAVERYKAANGLMTLGDAQASTVTEQEIATLDGQMATTRGEKAEADARLAAAKVQLAKGGQGDDLGEVLNSQVVQSLRRERETAAKQVAEMRGRYGPRHPEMLKAERGLADLDQQIEQEIARLVSNLEVQARIADSRSAALAASLTDAKAALARSNGAAVELRELQRNLESVRSLYQSFLDRAKQTAAQDGMARTDARLVAVAKPPAKPAWPNRPLLIAGALVAALVAGAVAILLADAREDGLYDGEDAARRLELRCVGMIPDPARLSPGGKIDAPADLLLEQPLSAFTESFRALRSALLLAQTATPIHTLALTSALPGEGKTTTCLGLGRIMARLGASVVVVDCDLRRRTMSRLIAPGGAGLLDVLSGHIDLDQALRGDRVKGLFVLPLGDEAPAEDEIVESAAMDRLLETLRRRFRFVLLDTAPVLLVAETRALAAKADSVVVLARWGKTPATAVIEAVRLLKEAGADIAGVALTIADLRRAGRSAYTYAPDYYPFYRSPPPGAGRYAPAE